MRDNGNHGGGEGAGIAVMQFPVVPLPPVARDGLAGNFRARRPALVNRARVGVIAAILSSGPAERAQLVWRRASHLHTVVQRNTASIVGPRRTSRRSRQICLFILVLFMLPSVLVYFSASIELAIKLSVQGDPA